jgi:hypothetical protein
MGFAAPRRPRRELGKVIRSDGAWDYNETTKNYLSDDAETDTRTIRRD